MSDFTYILTVVFYNFRDHVGGRNNQPTVARLPFHPSDMRVLRYLPILSIRTWYGITIVMRQDHARNKQTLQLTFEETGSKASGRRANHITSSACRRTHSLLPYRHVRSLLHRTSHRVLEQVRA